MKIAIPLFAVVLIAPSGILADEGQVAGQGYEPGDKVETSPHGVLTGADERQGRPSETARPGPEGSMAPAESERTSQEGSDK